MKFIGSCGCVFGGKRGEGGGEWMVEVVGEEREKEILLISR